MLSFLNNERLFRKLWILLVLQVTWVVMPTVVLLWTLIVSSVRELCEMRKEVWLQLYSIQLHFLLSSSCVFPGKSSPTEVLSFSFIRSESQVVDSNDCATIPQSDHGTIKKKGAHPRFVSSRLASLCHVNVSVAN